MLPHASAVGAVKLKTPMNKKLTENDKNLIECPIFSNNLSGVVERANGFLDDITTTDLITMDDKRLASKLHALKNALAKAQALSEEITDHYYSRS
jgi:hypothetical protein